MEIGQYFDGLDKSFEAANRVASAARAKGYDPSKKVEILAAPDLASRVEGIIGVEGIADIIRDESQDSKSRQDLAFRMVNRICKDDEVAKAIRADGKLGRMDMSVKIGLAILTEGILVAPTEGFQGVEMHKNSDGSDYVAALYAGPIRGAGGTSAALSVALLDLARKHMGVGTYKAQAKEVERYLEEIQLYNARAARLQYMPPEDDIRTIFENCPVCIDGLPTEEFEVSLHRDITRLGASGKEERMTNRVRGGIALVSCEGIAQKAKNILKYTKLAQLDWNWLNNIIKVDKGSAQHESSEKDAVFLHEQVAGRPIFAYPEHPGAFRLRYGRSRFTGIAAKGLNPATMVLLKFIAVGTQLKIEKPGKGCIVMPVDSIEGPFVKLKSGEAFRVNDVPTARRVYGNISKILSVGDMLITLGDFKKSNTRLMPTSYVEEYWCAQIKEKGQEQEAVIGSFADAYSISKKHSVPLHPRYLYDYADIQDYDVQILADAIRKSSLRMDRNGESLFNLEAVFFEGELDRIRGIVERICIPHFDFGDKIEIRGDDAQSLLSAFGFSKEGMIDLSTRKMTGAAALEMLNSVSELELRRRAYRIGGRMGRPEKAKERLMKPAPNVLFPIAEHGGKDRNLSKAYFIESKKLKSSGVLLDIASFRCSIGKEYVGSGFCSVHNCSADIERRCKKCGARTTEKLCLTCGTPAYSNEQRNVNMLKTMNSALTNIGVSSVPKSVKGVGGLVSRDKISEPLEKGILRSMHNVYIFKDGTARFDATDAPITHFYPKEIGTSIEKLAELGYRTDCFGNGLVSEDQLVELMHQDVILNRRAGDYFFRVSKFIDDLLDRHYKMDRFYRLDNADGLIGHCVITLSPHTSAGVLGRIIGFTDASIGLCHPYLVCARRRNCDGDEDTTMLLLDGLINFSREYLPTTVGGTMDAPLILTLNVNPAEVDDEVHEMEVVREYSLEFYDATAAMGPPSDAQVESVKGRISSNSAFSEIWFTHESSANAIPDSPLRSFYTTMKTMDEKVEEQFKLMDILCSIDRKDTASRLITSHFIPDLMGNLHSFSKQKFRCIACNAKYRRVPLTGTCERCGGKIVLTISKGGIEKYLVMATDLADRYDLDPYIKQRVRLLKNEIDTVFGVSSSTNQRQFSLAKFL